MNFFVILQAPYLIYVEVVACENAQSSPVPCKMMDNAMLRRIHSQEDVAISSAESAVSSSNSPLEHHSPRTEPSFVNSAASGSSSGLGCHFDDTDCWSQEEDEIIQVHHLFFYITYLNNPLKVSVLSRQ